MRAFGLRCQRYTPCPHSGKRPSFTSGKCPLPDLLWPLLLSSTGLFIRAPPLLHLPAPVAQLEVQQAPAPEQGPPRSDLWAVHQSTTGPCPLLTLPSGNQAQ